MLPHWKWAPCRTRGLFSQRICASEDSSDLLRANQGIFKAEPRDSCAVCTLRVYPPTSPYPILSAEAEPISWGHCRKWRHRNVHWPTLLEFQVGCPQSRLEEIIPKFSPIIPFFLSKWLLVRQEVGQWLGPDAVSECACVSFPILLLKFYWQWRPEGPLVIATKWININRLCRFKGGLSLDS